MQKNLLFLTAQCPTIFHHQHINPVRHRLPLLPRDAQRGFEQPFTLGGCTLHGTASIGIAIYPVDGSTRDSLVSSADAAMYVAKQTKP